MLVPGIATGIGSLPHSDPYAAAEVVLRCLPEMPAAPQLPTRDPREGMLAQWLDALPEVTIDPDGRIALTGASEQAPECVFDVRAHAGLLAFLDAASSADQPPARVKVQLTGPLTLGVALRAAGMPTKRAFRRAAVTARLVGRSRAFVAARLPRTGRRPLLRRACARVVASRRSRPRP